ncbi:MAG: alpha/beta hydrolase [Sphingomonadaceae bacterium]
MKWAAALAVLLLAQLPAMPALAQSGQPPLPTLMTARAIAALPAAKPDKILRYGESAAQKIELFLPRKREADARLPVVALLGDSCFRREKAQPELLRAAAAAFIAKGFAVWSVDYRHIDEEGGGFPGTLTDVGAALNLIRAEAESHHLDADRVVLFGHGTGGWLALWAAGRHQLATENPSRGANPLRPQGMLLAGGFTDLAAQGPLIDLHCGDGTVAGLSAGGEEAAPEMALPPTRVPAILLHGIYDDRAFPAIGLAHARRARKTGDLAEIQLAPNAGHYEVIAPGTRAFSQALAAVARLANR